MKKFVFVAVAFLLGVGSVIGAEVTNITLSHQPGVTVAKIDLTGQVRYTHQTEVPKEGRGHRVIIDILAATHQLGQKEFLELPDCLVQSIRSSQFAATPEQIVRLVFDVKKAPLYRIESDKTSITVHFTDKEATSFADWQSSASVPKPVLAEAKPVTDSKTMPVAKNTQLAQAPKPVEKLADKPIQETSVEAKPTPAPPSAEQDFEQFAMGKRTNSKPATWVESKKVEPLTVAQAAPELPADEISKPSIVKETPKSSQPTPTKANPKSEPVVSKPVMPVLATAHEPSAKPLINEPAPKPQAKEHRPVVVVKEDDSAPKGQSAPPAKMPLKSEMESVGDAAKDKPVHAEASVKAPVEKKSEPKSEKMATKGQSALANKITGESAPPTTTVASTDNKPDSKSSTSRFRRNPNQGRINGTMVVEFPKRLVIKYKGANSRDPFETLINATRTSSNPLEKRVPNIEGLRLVGVIESDAKADQALFEDNDGFGYILRSGDKVRNGYVLRVESDKVYFQIFEYGWSRTVALQLEQ